MVSKDTEALELVRMMKALIITSILAFLIPQVHVKEPMQVHPAPKYEVQYLEPLEAPEITKIEQVERVTVPKPKLVQTSSKKVTDTKCTGWMAEAGIAHTNATRTLILNESGCRWWVKNPKSGACGIPQAYPCSKLPCPLTEAGAVCQLKWMKAYVAERYGTWEKALSFWYSQCGTSKGCWY